MPAIAEFERQQSIPPQSPFLPSTNSLPIHTRISQISRMLKIPKRRGFHRRPPPANQREGLANPTRQRKSFLSSTSPPKLFFSCAPNLKSTTHPPLSPPRYLFLCFSDRGLVVLFLRVHCLEGDFYFSFVVELLKSQHAGPYCPARSTLSGSRPSVLE